MTDTLKTSSLRKRMAYAILIIVLAVLALAAAQIDDWSRDLTTNVAITHPESNDPLLRPTVVRGDYELVEQFLQKFSEDNEQWEHLRSEPGLPERRHVYLTHGTAWLGFKDDLLVELSPDEAGTLIEIKSQSRVGKGDFGQNPRNIRELNRAMREQLDVAE